MHMCLELAIFAAATGVVRTRQADGSIALSKPLNIARGVLQGDIFSPIAFIAGLDRIFRRHDVHTASITYSWVRRQLHGYV